MDTPYLNDKTGSHILVVDDNPANLQLMTTLLLEEHYQVRIATDGDQALQSVSLRPTDLILMDINMPGKNGIDTCLELKSNPETHDIPILFLSALSSTEDKLKAFSAGGVDYITKPFNKLEVLARINTHMSLRRTKQLLEKQKQHLQEEVNQRKKAEASLRTSRDELETQVEKRTRALIESNDALLASQNRYSDLYNNSPDMYVTVDAVTANVKQCNQTLANKLGYSKEEIIDQPIFNLYHADCMDDVHQVFQTFVRTGEVHNAELQLKRRDGSKIDVNLNVSSVRDNNGKVLYSRSCWIDISQRKQVERELSQLRNYLENVLNSMPSVLVGILPSGVVVHWNQQAERFSGISTEAAHGKMADDLLPLLKGRINFAENSSDTLQAQRLERVIYNHRGSQRFADIIVYPLESDIQNGAVIRIDDVTERVQVEAMMVQTEKMLSLGGLAGGMAHELNNPIGGMLQGAQNIQRRFSTELAKNQQIAKQVKIDMVQLQQYLQERDIYNMLNSMIKAGKRASVIVNNMLRFSRKPETVYQPVRIDELLDQTVELAAVDYDLKKKFDFRSIHIERIYQTGLPLLYCSPSEIQQVIFNLLRNAAQALTEQIKEAKPPHIILRTRQYGQQLQLSIEDNGPGMDAPTCKRVFEPFFTTKPPGQGTGLGLSVSYHIIHDEHGGDMRIESKIGLGCKFIITLPFNR